MELVKPFGKKILTKLIAQIYKKYQTTETSVVLDKMKDLGYKESTISGISISIGDILLAQHKEETLADANKLVEQINKQYRRGLITDRERYENVVQTWTTATNKIADELSGIIKGNKTNSISMMIDSGARGNMSQYNQMAGMRGLILKPTGEPVEIPITSSFVEGLSVSEFFMGTHGTRKGAVDTALKQPMLDT